jgi:acyl carrier protein phosphodiesterase
VNLLAHALLAGTEPGHVAGGVLADWIKGPIDPALPPDLAEGVRNHRRIDVATDAHPATARSRARLEGPWRRWSGVLVDLAYDHCLVSQWVRFGRGSIDGFIDEVGRHVAACLPRLPGPAAEAGRRMLEGGWLRAGESWDGVELALRRVSRRLRRPVALDGAVGLLRERERELTADFVEVFPDLAAAVRE